MRKRKGHGRKPAPKPSTALARRRPSAPARVTILNKPAPIDKNLPRALTDTIALGELGLVEVKLTPAEEAILGESVPQSEIRIIPAGKKAPATPYLPHPVYTRWFNRAFGRTGWALVPASKPMLANGCVVCPYILFIHGQPVAFAMGEQEYFDHGNQSYGDALESTVASALRRCAKRLGVGLEMWDRSFLDEVLAKAGHQARRADYVDADVAERPRRARESDNPAGHHAQSGDPISEKQVRRLWAIVKNSGRSDEEVKLWLQRRYRLDSSKKITRTMYESICSAIEAPGSLPEA